MGEKILGIDISRSAVSAVVVASDDSGHRIAAYARTPVEGRELRACVKETLASVREQADIDEAFCVTALPDSDLYYRSLVLPFADQRKIEKVLAYELEPLLPFPPGEAIVDFYISNASSATNGEGGTTVCAAVVPKDRLRKLLDGLADVGVDPDIVTSRAMATAAVWSQYKRDAFLVEADGGEVSATVIAGGETRLVRSFAARLDAVGDADKREREQICRRLRQTLLAYEEATGAKLETDTVLVAGPAVQTDGFSDTARKTLNLAPQLMNIADMPGLLEKGRPDHRWMPGYLEVALCLANLKQVRRPFFNFRRGEFAVTRKWGQYRDALVKTGVLALLVVVLGLIGFFYDIHRAHDKIAAIKERQRAVFGACFSDIPAASASLDRMKSELIRMRQESGVTQEMHRKASCVDILNDISRLIPGDADIVVSRLVVGPDDAVLSGETDAFNSVDMIKNKLAESAFFGTIEISSANMDKVANRVQFKLRLELL